MDRINTFTISYSNFKSCDIFPIDYPLTVNLANIFKSGYRECFTYGIYKYEDIQITIFMSHLDKLKLQNSLKLKLNFLKTGKEVLLDKHDQMIRKNDLSSYCGSNSS